MIDVLCKAKAEFGKDTGVVVFMTKEQVSRKTIPAGIGAGLSREITDAVKDGLFEGGADETFYFVHSKSVVLLYGLGKKGELSGRKLRGAVRHGVKNEKFSSCKTLYVAPFDKSASSTVAFVEGIVIGGYAWDKYISKSKKEKRVALEDKKIYLLGADKKTVAEVLENCAGVNFARDLVNENADVKNSAYIVERIQELVKDRKDAELCVLGREELEKQGLNLLLAVNKGSQYEPRLVVVEYKGGKTSQKYTALVGKGITFDSGGLNLKPTGHIEEMRMDMGGTAAVLGALKNVLSIKPRKNILFVFAIAENAIGQKSYKPGDVVTGYSGKTVEIGNTDAEGRLVLADANAYVCKNYAVETLVNIATLTGAVLSALGQDHAGLMSDSDELCQELLKCADQTDDKAWPLPIYPELKSYLKSKYADIRNIATPRGQCGSITAGQFLREFVPAKVKWAHLDIAGTAFNSSGEHAYYGYGATGYGVRIFTRFVCGKK